MLALLAVAVMCIVVSGCGGGEPADSRGDDRGPTGGERSSEALGQAGHGDSDSNGLSRTPIPTASRTPDNTIGLLGQGTFVNLLELIPATRGGRIFVSVNDYRRARDAHNIKAPGDDASNEDLEEYVGALSQTGMALGPWISGFTNFALSQLEHREHLGFDVGDMDQSIRSGYPPNVVEAATGRFDPKTTKSSLGRCTECPEPEIHEHLGIEFYSWGADYQPNISKSLQPPAFDHLGIGGRIALLDSHVFRTQATEAMRTLISTYVEQGDLLADDADLALAARELDGLGVYSAYLVGDVEIFVSACEYCTPEQRTELESRVKDTLLDEYIVLGTGVGNDEDGLYAVLVFVYGEEADAERNVPVFEERLATAVSLDSGQIWSDHFPQGDVWNDGRALIAKLRTENPRIWGNMVLGVESLLWHK